MHDLNIFAMASQKIEVFFNPANAPSYSKAKLQIFSPWCMAQRGGKKMEKRGEGEEEASKSLKLGPKFGPSGIVRIWKGSTLVPF